MNFDLSKVNVFGMKMNKKICKEVQEMFKDEIKQNKHCMKCGKSGSIKDQMLQIRSADEQATFVRICLNCGERYNKD